MTQGKSSGFGLRYQMVCGTLKCRLHVSCYMTYVHVNSQGQAEYLHSHNQYETIPLTLAHAFASERWRAGEYCRNFLRKSISLCRADEPVYEVHDRTTVHNQHVGQYFPHLQVAGHTTVGARRFMLSNTLLLEFAVNHTKTI